MYYRTSQYFPKAFKYTNINVKVELDISSYITRSDKTEASGIDTLVCSRKLFFFTKNYM